MRGHQVELGWKDNKGAGIGVLVGHAWGACALASQVQHFLARVDKFNVSGRRTCEQPHQEPSISVAKNESSLRVADAGQIAESPPLQFSSERGVFKPAIHARDGVAIHLMDDGKKHQRGQQRYIGQNAKSVARKLMMQTVQQHQRE